MSKYEVWPNVDAEKHASWLKHCRGDKPECRRPFERSQIDWFAMGFVAFQPSPGFTDVTTSVFAQGINTMHLRSKLFAVALLALVASSASAATVTYTLDLSVDN